MSEEIYKRQRPKTFKAMMGQEASTKALAKMVTSHKVPHSILFQGPSGTGKTTLARIMANKLEADPTSDIEELNCADFRGIDMVREIRQRMGLSPIGQARVWIIDEAHKLSGDAQNAFLKILEDTPRRAYFFLCTTDPEKLLKTIRTRCTPISLKGLDDKTMTQLILQTAGKEDIDVAEDVLTKMVEAAEGSPRQALVLLDLIRNLEDEEDQLQAIAAASGTEEAIKIARGLLNGMRWPEMKKILRDVAEEPEKLRWMILGYCTSILLSDNAKQHARASAIIDTFRDNFYDCKKAGLVSCCFQILGPRK